MVNSSIHLQLCVWKNWSLAEIEQVSCKVSIDDLLFGAQD